MNVTTLSGSSGPRRLPVAEQPRARTAQPITQSPSRSTATFSVQQRALESWIYGISCTLD